MIIDGQSYLLLIRDEGGAPEMQFTHWADAVILVFSLDSEQSFQQARHHFLQMGHYRHLGDLPLLLVATRDHVTDARPRLVDEARARALALELGRAVPLYETCALKGHNVERVFYDACHRVVNWRAQMLVAMANIAAASLNTRPLTPSQQQQQQQVSHFSGVT